MDSDEEDFFVSKRGPAQLLPTSSQDASSSSPEMAPRPTKRRKRSSDVSDRRASTSATTLDDEDLVILPRKSAARKVAIDDADDLRDSPYSLQALAADARRQRGLPSSTPEPPPAVKPKAKPPASPTRPRSALSNVVNRDAAAEEEEEEDDLSGMDANVFIGRSQEIKDGKRLALEALKAKRQKTGEANVRSDKLDKGKSRAAEPFASVKNAFRPASTSTSAELRGVCPICDKSPSAQFPLSKLEAHTNAELEQRSKPSRSPAHVSPWFQPRSTSKPALKPITKAAASLAPKASTVIDIDDSDDDDPPPIAGPNRMHDVDEEGDEESDGELGITLDKIDPAKRRALLRAAGIYSDGEGDDDEPAGPRAKLNDEWGGMLKQEKTAKPMGKPRGKTWGNRGGWRGKASRGGWRGGGRGRRGRGK